MVSESRPVAPREPGTSSVLMWCSRKPDWRSVGWDSHWLRTAWSSLKVPLTLLSRKALFPSIERSTWFSAAKYSTRSGSISCTAFAVAAASARSTCNRRWRSAVWGPKRSMLLRSLSYPILSRFSTEAVDPARRRRTKAPPKKPPPPVISRSCLQATTSAGGGRLGTLGIWNKEWRERDGRASQGDAAAGDRTGQRLAGGQLGSGRASAV